MSLKLHMVLLGSKAPGRNVEQHDFFFGIGTSLAGLLPAMREFWPEAGDSLHIDGWREVTQVEGYRVNILDKPQADPHNRRRLFFINLGGYQSGKLEEQHYTLLTVQEDRKQAVKASTGTDFFKTASIEKVKAAAAHIDEKYGIDVDEIYHIEDLLSPGCKALYHIELLPDQSSATDEIHLGYLKLNQWNNGLKH
ncbi:DUF1543 domain-containing protein [Mucilaginibacter mali]|uniref:DUF1543 domain-containing protein n=1 Tax=Mucilaginibacter mali TaxID=2740462 RepID=A0A7D4QG47_9SPHI|nr:DUF1543 domain-containing protein [Mucilaginibacter mali]QKJ32924.1 DUF1543 domain-containing protein [Mucilaginibacter mali]